MRAKSQRDPIQLLLKEHEEGLVYLAQLESAVNSIRRDGFSVEAFREMAVSVRAIGAHFKEHDLKEEQYLLPPLEKHLSVETQKYRDEHRELRYAFSNLLTTVENIEEGTITGSTVLDLLDAAQSILVKFREHMARENAELFPTVKDILTNDEYQTLTKAITNKDS